MEMVNHQSLVEKSDSEQRQTILSRLEELAPRQADSDWSILESYPPGLNQKEIALFIENPTKGTKALYYGNTALSEAERRWTDSATDGNGDAFRHASWTALMMVFIDYDWSLRWSNAHEEGDTVQGPLGKQMDYWNNNEGLRVGSVYPGSPEAVILTAIENHLKSGFCRRIVNGALVKTNGDNHR